ncbi:MAG TPA: chitobiase/beta-hexosaminidase C-terminal domain-containing protein [Terriglobales bacterium]|nr:chitobiase/beta-hexosaminidase C-terminal domain-containing protein [Terriglobales bacterium]
MKKHNTNQCISFFLLALTILSPLFAHAQCYLNKGCKPVDNLTYTPNGTGQVYHGDGASNNGAGGWTTNNADVNQCLSCHYGTDTLPYLWSGHRNVLRKAAPGTLWGGPDASSYSTTDDFYGSGSTYDWTNNLVTIGWCNPLATPVQNGLPINDESCTYPFYTLPNAHAPAPYTPVAPTKAAGGVRDLYYLQGGWMSFGGTANPSSTQLNTIFDKGFTGENYPNGNFDCARCHTTGYNFDHWGPEPTSNTGNTVAWIPDAQLSRIPTDGYIAPGTSGTSSWYLSGVQCERCHAAAWGYGSHPRGGLPATVVYNEAATALCMECHRQENVTIADSTQPGSIAPTTAPQAQDAGYCSDLSGAGYTTCIVNPSNQWIYKPFIDHEQGQSFLNSPHARFTGNLIQNAQHSPDLSITIAGTYASQFSENIADSTKNSGCTGCHDPHQSTVSTVPLAYAPKPIVKTCDQCHKLAQNILATINHPAGPGTPFPTGAASDIPGACVTCHMQGALGTPTSHLFRINADVSYRTYPTPDQLYNLGITALGTAPEYSPMDGTTFNPAIWLDVDLACGQCHVGGDGKTNPYGLTMPPGMPGAHAYTKTQLAYWASVMHPPDPGVPAPTFSPAPGTYNRPQRVSISDSLSGATIYYTTDGSLPNTSSPVYSGPIDISVTTTFRAMATHAGYPRSTVMLATYSIILPLAPAPTFSPTPSTFSGPQSVRLSNTLNLPMFYTLDGSTPTTSSTPYSAPISVTQNTNIKAITAAYGYLNSSVSSGTYLIQAPAPTFSPSSGTYNTAQSVTISDTVVGATIYYTTNGSTPSTSSTSCGNPCALTVSATTTLKAIAAGGGYAASTVAVATYTIQAAAPTFSPAAGTYYTPITVTISDTTAGATIYYAINGFPTTSSLSCTSPCTVSISTTTTLRAMAAGSGLSQSGTSVAVYTIAANTPTFSPAPGTYSAPQSVAISDTTSGVTIYYTTNGSFPTTSSTSCSNPCTITVSTTTVVRAIAAGTGISQSGVGVGSYTITGP